MPRKGIAALAVILGLFVLACGGGGVTVVPGAPAGQATAAPTAAPASVAKVGDRVELNDMALTVVKAERAAELGQFGKAKEGNEFIVTEVIIENVNTDKLSYNLLYFKARDADGFEYTTALGVEQPLSSGELAKGEKVRGNVAFEVKKVAKALVMEYRPLGAPEAIKVALN